MLSRQDGATVADICHVALLFDCEDDDGAAAGLVDQPLAVWPFRALLLDERQEPLLRLLAAFDQGADRILREL